MTDRSLRLVPSLLWMTVIFALSSQPQFPQPFGWSAFLMSVVAHLLLYGTLAVLLLIGLKHRSRPRRSTYLLAVVIAVGYGVTDEIHQSFVPGRDASLFDLVVNATGAAVAAFVWSQRRSFLTSFLGRS